MKGRTMIQVKDHQKLRCKKIYGVWYYDKWVPEYEDDEIDGDFFNLYNENGEHVFDFGCYADMKYYVETGEIIA